MIGADMQRQISIRQHIRRITQHFVFWLISIFYLFFIYFCFCFLFYVVPEMLFDIQKIEGINVTDDDLHSLLNEVDVSINGRLELWDYFQVQWAKWYLSASHVDYKQMKIKNATFFSTFVREQMQLS